MQICVETTDNLADGIFLSNRLKPITTFLDMHVPLAKGEPVCNDWMTVADAVPRMIPPVIGITGLDITPEMKIYCLSNRGMQHLYRKPYTEGFFAKFRADMKFFAAKLIDTSGDAALRANGNT
jgi:hypothetical protein